MDFQEKIIQKIAEDEANRICRKTISLLVKITDTLSGDDSELQNAWDEICVQVQQEESFSWEIYETMTLGFIESFVKDIPSHLKQAIWLQTEAGVEWMCDFDNLEENYVEQDQGPPVRYGSNYGVSSREGTKKSW